jgi:adenylate kinase family enzyme
VLRVHAANRPDLADRWQRRWDRGRMAPDEEVLPVLWRHYESLITFGPAILDGYPRILPQLDDFSARGGRLGTALLLEPGEAAAIERLRIRQHKDGRRDDHLAIARDRIRRSRTMLGQLTRDPRISAILAVVDTGHATADDTYQEVLRILRGREFTS